MTQLNFNAANVAPATGQADPAPAGWYKMAIEASEAKPTKDSATTGNKFLELKVGIIEGQHNGKKVFTRLNLWNANPVASEIAQKELSAIGHATGVLMIQDSQQLHGIPVMVKLKLKPAEGQYEAQNEIVAWRPANFIPDPVPGVGGAMPVGAAPPVAQPWAGGGAPQAPAQPWGQAPQQQPQQWQQPQQPAQPPAQPPAPAQQAWQAPAGQAPQQPWQQPQQPPQPPMQPPAAAPQQTWQQAPQPPQPPVAGAPGPGAFPPAAAPAVDPNQNVPPWQRPPAG